MSFFTRSPGGRRLWIVVINFFIAIFFTSHYVASFSWHHTSLAAQTLNIRGGSSNDSEKHTTASDDGGDEKDSESGSDNNNDEMQSLRKEWSTQHTPALPSIEWPFRDAMLHDGDTLPDLHDSTLSTKTKAIILMDGFCPYHGQYIAKAAHHLYGAAVIPVLSDFCTRYLFQVEKETDHLSNRIPDLSNGEEIGAWISLLPPSIKICGIYCESDSGLDDAERLGVALGLYPRCHDGVNVARRDKFAMNKVVSKAGLDVVKQKSCKTLDEAEEFAKELGLLDDAAPRSSEATTKVDEENTSTLVVVKPHRGVASDDVHLCSNMESLREAFAKIHSSPVFGSSTSAKHQSVLVQEFARGTEYAIDVVCRDGEQKVAALWKYDKRSVNGAPFVYYATKLIPAAGEGVEEAVCNYVFDALEALDIRWGLSHVEVIVSPNDTDASDPIRVRLVEVNCRQHNTDFLPLTNACVGYNALDMVLAAYLGEDDESMSSHQYPAEAAHLRLPWREIPQLPTTRAHGAIIHFVSHVRGKISRINYDILQEMEDLPSVMDFHVYPQFMEVGNVIEKTIDIRSDSGWAHLMNDDEEEFQRDYDRLIELQKEMFEVE